VTDQVNSAETKRVSIEANLWRRFYLDRLSIEPALVAAKHEFSFEGKHVTIALPALDPKAVRGQEKIACHRWHGVAGQEMVPTQYEVYCVDMRVDLGEQIQVPEEALKPPPIHPELFDQSERTQLKKLTDDHVTLSTGAFTYWLKVLRWKSGIGHIGEPRVSYPDRAGGAALQDTASGNRFWLQSYVIVAEPAPAVTSDQWKAAQAALTERKTPPIPFDFLFDGEQRLNNGDLIGSVLSMAVALEATIRTLATHHLSKLHVEELIFRLIDRTNLRSILGQLRFAEFLEQ